MRLSEVMVYCQVAVPEAVSHVLSADHRLPDQNLAPVARLISTSTFEIPENSSVAVPWMGWLEVHPDAL